MIKIMSDLPDNVLGIYADGNISDKDYETVLNPAVEGRLKNNRKLRVLFQLASGFESAEFGTMVTDSNWGKKYASTWEKIAVVSDHDLMNSTTAFSGLFNASEVRIFNTRDLEDAKKWIAASIDSSATEDDNKDPEADLDSDKVIAKERESGENSGSQGHINTNFPLSGGNPD